MTKLLQRWGIYLFIYLFFNTVNGIYLAIQPEQPLVVNRHGSSSIEKPGKYKGAKLVYSNQEKRPPVDKKNTKLHQPPSCSEYTGSSDHWISESHSSIIILQIQKIFTFLSTSILKNVTPLLKFALYLADASLQSISITYPWSTKSQWLNSK